MDHSTMAVFTGNANPVGDLAALLGSQHLELLCELLVALGGEEHFLQDFGLQAASVGLRPDLGRRDGREG